MPAGDNATAHREATRQTIEPMEIPAREVINQRRVARFHERITAGLAHPDLESFSASGGTVSPGQRRPAGTNRRRSGSLAVGDTPLLLTEDLDGDRFLRKSQSSRRVTSRSQVESLSRVLAGRSIDGVIRAGRSRGSNPGEWTRSESSRLLASGQAGEHRRCDRQRDGLKVDP